MARFLCLEALEPQLSLSDVLQRGLDLCQQSFAPFHCLFQLLRRFLILRLQLPQVYSL